MNRHRVVVVAWRPTKKTERDVIGVWCGSVPESPRSNRSAQKLGSVGSLHSHIQSGSRDRVERIGVGVREARVSKKDHQSGSKYAGSYNIRGE